VEQMPGEDRNDAGLSLWVLARAVDVRQRERGVLELVQLSIRVQVIGESLLRDAVRRQRALRLRLLQWKIGGISGAVDRATARREHDLAGARRPRALQHIVPTDDVD